MQRAARKRASLSNTSNDNLSPTTSPSTTRSPRASKKGKLARGKDGPAGLPQEAAGSIARQQSAPPAADSTSALNSQPNRRSARVAASQQQAQQTPSASRRSALARPVYRTDRRLDSPAESDTTSLADTSFGLPEVGALSTAPTTPLSTSSRNSEENIAGVNESDLKSTLTKRLAC